jgi:PAS domain-containing protein
VAQHPIEMISLKQWVSLMAVPEWISDADGGLIYYNEHAEEIVGLHFEGAGELPADRVAEVFAISDLSPLPDDQSVAYRPQQAGLDAPPTPFSQGGQRMA